jgi:hypothetical protein
MEKVPSNIPAGTIVEPEGAGFWVAYDDGGAGTIRSEDGTVLSRYRSSGRLARFVDAMDQEMLVVERERQGPFSRWVSSKGGRQLWTLRCRGFWLSRYDIDFCDGWTWTIRFPLFTLWYPCSSNRGEECLVRLVQHTAWFVGALPASGGLPLLAAFAIIQRQRQWA